MMLLPHTHLEVGSVSTAVLVCGDPGRATFIASFMEDAVLLAEWREYRTYQGMFHGRSVAVSSHGIGAPGAAICFEELAAAGAKTIIRVGSCGGIAPTVRAGDLVIGTAAMDSTGYGREVVPPGFPAVADMDVTLALRQKAIGQARPCHTGLVLSRDAFYPGIATPFDIDYQELARAHVLAVEMECAALFLVGSLRGVRTGTILAVNNHVLAARESIESYKPDMVEAQQAMETAVQIALHALAELDDKSG